MFGTESAFYMPDIWGVNKFIIIDDESHRFSTRVRKIWCQRITVRG
uniref:Uncharacterized protein n=1 Tax=Klebsiella pneumoniae TaxID=573 RepID=A0A8B0SR87_KLEPN|nr:hypothetical protein [Klebsiella pneumoniae]